MHRAGEAQSRNSYGSLPDSWVSTLHGSGTEEPGQVCALHLPINSHLFSSKTSFQGRLGGSVC